VKRILIPFVNIIDGLGKLGSALLSLLILGRYFVVAPGVGKNVVPRHSTIEKPFKLH